MNKHHEEFHSEQCSIYIYGNYHPSPSHLLDILAATPVYLSHVKHPISGNHHITQRSLGVLLHKLGIR